MRLSTYADLNTFPTLSLLKSHWKTILIGDTDTDTNTDQHILDIERNNIRFPAECKKNT